MQMSRDGFAEAIGHSPKSGPFGVLVGSMSLYGLVDTGDKNLTFTDLTKAIMFGTSSEQDNSKARAVAHVKLFADIYARYGRDVTDEQLRLFLRETAGVDIAQAGEKANEIGKIFKKVSGYLTTAPAASAQQSLGGEAKKMDGETQTTKEPEKVPSDMEQYKLGSGVVIMLPKDSDQALTLWGKAKKAMDIILGVSESATEGKE